VVLWQACTGTFDSWVYVAIGTGCKPKPCLCPCSKAVVLQIPDSGCCSG
jgi:hypothetical protein